MRRIKTTAIRTETVEQIVSFRVRGSDLDGFCLECRAPAAWLTLVSAASDSQLTLAEVCSRLEAGHLHSQLTGDGHILVCERSLGEMCNLTLKSAGRGVDSEKG